MYAGVPITEPAIDSEPASRPLRTVVDRRVCGLRLALRAPLVGDAAAGSTLARPQSTTCTSPKAPTMMFAGFRSRWITPRAWA